MATNSTWTVVFDDKRIIKQSGDDAGAYDIVDDAFWGLAKWNNIWAIQYETSNSSDAVEYRDETSNSTWEDANLGDFQDFITKWDSAHLAELQSNWDNNNEQVEDPADSGTYRDETSAEKIIRLGARPTSYSS